MPAIFPIIVTLLRRAFWYRQQLLLWFLFYLLNRSKTLAFYRYLQFWESKKVSEKSHAQHRCWCAIMVQNSWLIVPQFCAFLANCFAQSTHYFKVVFLAMPTDENSEQNLHNWPNLRCFFRSWFFWALPFGMIELWFQCHSHTYMIRHQLRPFWGNLDRRWTLSTSPEQCPSEVVFIKI